MLVEALEFTTRRGLSITRLSFHGRPRTRLLSLLKIEIHLLFREMDFRSNRKSSLELDVQVRSKFIVCQLLLSLLSLIVIEVY